VCVCVGARVRVRAPAIYRVTDATRC